VLPYTRYIVAREDDQILTFIKNVIIDHAQQWISISVFLFEHEGLLYIFSDSIVCYQMLPDEDSSSNTTKKLEKNMNSGFKKIQVLGESVVD